MHWVLLLAFQVIPPDTARLRQHLPEVTVKALPPVQILRAPGETKGLQTAFGREVPPGRAVAVWHGPPDTTQAYVVRAIRVKLGTRIPEAPEDLPKHRRNLPEGRLRLWLSPGTLTTGPEASRNLLREKLLLTAETAERKGWIRIDVADQQLVLPRSGAFVVVEGLPTTDEETFVRHRILANPYTTTTQPKDLDFQKIQPGKNVRSYLYEEIRQADGSLRLVSTHSFPTVAYRLVKLPTECHSWLLVNRSGQVPAWSSVPQNLVMLRQALPDAAGKEYN